MKRRFLVLTSVLVLGFSAVMIRCWQLQIVSEGTFEDQALRNQLRTFPIPAERGEILDRHGMVLAGNRNAYRVKLLDPSLPVLHTQIELLASILGDSVDEVKKNSGLIEATTSTPSSSAKI